jgi:hypothetical protein
MVRKSRILVALAFAVLLVGTEKPAASQKCEYEDAVREVFQSRTTGTGLTWTDVLSRLIAQVDSLDLDNGETTTDLTWNINKYLTAKASVVNEPSLFQPLKEAIGEDADLLSQLSDRLGQGDDWKISIDYNFQSASANLGTRAVLEGAVLNQVGAWKAELAKQGFGEAVRGEFGEMSCAERFQLFRGMAPFIAMELAKTKPQTLTVNAFYQSRDDLAGQDERGFSIKYTRGLSDAKAPAMSAAAASRAPTMEDAIRVAVGNMPSLESRITASLAGPNDPAALASAAANLRAGASSAAERLRNAMADLPNTIDHRFAFEAQWKQKDAYSYPLSGSDPLTLPEDESIVVTAAYSLQYVKDGKAIEELPRYELSASYEDVDGDSARQSRLIAKAIASRKLEVMGENTELTVGLVWAEKPEYLADQEFDEQLSANLGLTFKFGSD